MLQKYWNSVPDAALNRADYFLQHNSDPRNEASESPYRLNGEYKYLDDNGKSEVHRALAADRDLPDCAVEIHLLDFARR